MQTRLSFLALPLLCLSAAAMATAEPPIAYHAEIVMVSNGKTIVTKVWSDGVRRKTEMIEDNGSRSGSYADSAKKLRWQYGPGYPCIQLPINPPSFTSKDEPLGSETIDGHPTKKFRVTTVGTVGGKKMTETLVEWRATDLKDLVIQRKFSDGSQLNLRNDLVGKPDEKLMAFPSPPCKYDESQDTTRYAAAAPGGFRSITFSDASCKKLIPLPLSLEIPSDYEIRQGGHMGCFWGTPDDLGRLLKVDDEADFDSIRHGVFWCRVSDSTEYDPIRKHFVSAQGTDDQWAKALALEAGARNVVVTAKELAGLPTLRVTATVGGKKVYMFYIGVADSPAILINYHPSGNGGPADDATWQHFLGSIASAQ